MRIEPDTPVSEPSWPRSRNEVENQAKYLAGSRAQLAADDGPYEAGTDRPKRQK